MMWIKYRHLPTSLIEALIPKDYPKIDHNIFKRLAFCLLLQKARVFVYLWLYEYYGPTLPTNYNDKLAG